MNPAEHLGLVHNIARSYARHYSQPLDELVQEGTFGLMTASRRFDPTRGVKFSTYALWWISAAMKTYAVEKSRLVAIPVKTAWALKKAGELPPPPSSLEDVPAIAEDVPTPEEIAAEREERAILRRQVGRLPKRVREIVRRHFFRGESKAEIAKSLGVSRQRVQQIVDVALMELKPMLERALR